MELREVREANRLMEEKHQEELKKNEELVEQQKDALAE